MRASIQRWLFPSLAFIGAFSAVYFWASTYPSRALAQESETMAADFPEDLDWINTSGKSLSLKDLRGKVVLLDFWTYGCINCIHIIPDLKKLEEKYAEELVVIGVHSAKFREEGNTENIRQTVARLELEHPVVNDNEFEIWKSYKARAWPTLALIDTKGRLLGKVAGEGHYAVLDKAIGQTIEVAIKEKTIDRSKLEFIKTDFVNDTQLRFPGGIEVDNKNKRLFVSDTLNHRIIVLDALGLVIDVIGNGEPGLADGDYASTRLKQPQGLSFAPPETLYVADTGNHSLRKIDLKTKRVHTVTGYGGQKYLNGDFVAGKQGLNSPWDVLHHEGKVYIAMAGQHQLWVYDEESKKISLFAGTAREELKDAIRSKAGFNQPMGLALGEKGLYVADAEASAIRQVQLTKLGGVLTIVGTGLFDFGDRDGSGKYVRLQHPQSVAEYKGDILIADSYNDNIKTLNVEKRKVDTIFGRDGELDEPGAITVLDDQLYIANTNMHNIVVYDLEDGGHFVLPLDDPDNKLGGEALDTDAEHADAESG